MGTSGGGLPMPSVGGVLSVTERPCTLVDLMTEAWMQPEMTRNCKIFIAEFQNPIAELQNSYNSHVSSREQRMLANYRIVVL
jgi:hypothetical protein